MTSRERPGILRGGEFRRRFPIDKSYTPPRWSEELQPVAQWTPEECDRIEKILTESQAYKKTRDLPKFEDGEVRGWDPNANPWMRLLEDFYILPVRSYAFQANDFSEIVLYMYPTLLACGSKGYLHGGNLALFLDDASGAIVVASRASNNQMTAYIKVNYKLPVKCLQWLCFRVKIRERTGRKWFVDGTVENLEGTVLTTSDALMIEIPDTHLTAPKL